VNQESEGAIRPGLADLFRIRSVLRAGQLPGGQHSCETANSSPQCRSCIGERGLRS